MTTTPLTLQLNSSGPLSGQLYTPGQSDRKAGAKLVILLHGWGADGADLLPLALLWWHMTAVMRCLCRTPLTFVQPTLWPAMV